jgi:hypothetical protein
LVCRSFTKYAEAESQTESSEMHSHSIITYVVVLPADADKSDTPFQGFAFRLQAVTKAIDSILQLPATFVEMHLPREDVIVERAVTGGYQIIPLDVGALERLPVYPAARFVVLISGPGTDEAAASYAARSKLPILHVTTAVPSPIPRLDELTREHLQAHCERAIAFIRERYGSLVVPELGLPVRETPLALHYTASDHFLTSPNELALESLGYLLETRESPLKAMNVLPSGNTEEVNAPYAKLILDSAKVLASVRTAAIARSIPVPGRTAVDLILTAPAVYHHIGPELLRPELPEAERKTLGILMRELRRQRFYPQLVLKDDEMTRVFRSTNARALLSVRKAELNLYTGVVAARACGYAAPVLRLPPGVNQMRSQLGDLARCVAGRGPRKGVKLSKLARRIGNSFRSIIDPSHLAMIEELPAHAAVKLITDAPLEIVPVGNLPLGLRFVCTRIPVTPGNLLTSHALGCRPIHLEVADLSRVLIINAFQPGDPLRGLLRFSLTESLLTAPRRLDIEWVDVDGVDSFRSALNSFDGRIVLFDGHGSYSRKLGHGVLRLGEEDVDIWSLTNQVRVPPIVILSACDTHPMDGTQATVANAFLMLGAQTVLASLVPLDGIQAAILVGRLMLRLAMYLPEVEQTPIFPLRWSEIVTGMLRMSYITDVLAALQRAGWKQLTSERTQVIQLAANDFINYLHPEWFEKTLELIADVTGIGLDEVKEAHLTKAYFVETLHYVQLGNPEEIMVVRPRAG